MLTLQYYKHVVISILRQTQARNLKLFPEVSTNNGKCHPLSTGSGLSFRYETMAQPPHKRVLVKLWKDGTFESAHFTQVLIKT